MGRLVFGVALEQLAARPEHEGQHQAFGLGKLERCLECLLRSAPVAEAIPRRGVEQQRLDARPPLGECRRRAFDDRRQRVDGLVGVVLFERQCRERDADHGTVALIRAQTGECEPRSLGIAHPNPNLESPGARFEGEHVLTGEPSLQAVRPREGRQGFVEPALAEAQHAAGMVKHDLGPRVGGQAERVLRPSEMALGFGEAPHPHERRAGHRKRADRHRLAGPAMLLGDRQRPLAQLERERQWLAGKRRHDREMREAAQLEERPWDSARVAEGVLEVLPGVVGTAGPQLCDAEIDEHECPVVGQHRQLVRLCRGAERCFQAARCFLSPGQIAVPAGELDIEESQVHVEEAPSLRRDRRREAPSDA